jgi:FixJ family two-component response regulator
MKPEKRLIAFVDDETILRDIAQELLPLHGYAVDTFASADAILKEYLPSNNNNNNNRASHVSCFVIDWDLATTNGVELYHALSEHLGPIATVFISGYEPQEMTALCSQPNINFVKKPFHMKTLTHAIAHTIESRDDQHGDLSQWTSEQ